MMTMLVKWQFLLHVMLIATLMLPVLLRRTTTGQTRRKRIPRHLKQNDRAGGSAMKASSDKPTVPRKQLEAMTNFILKWDGQTPIENDKDLAKLLEDKACFEAFVATVEMIHGPIGMELNLLRKNESSSQEEENHDKI